MGAGGFFPIQMDMVVFIMCSEVFSVPSNGLRKENLLTFVIATILCRVLSPVEQSNKYCRAVHFFSSKNAIKIGGNILLRAFQWCYPIQQFGGAFVRCGGWDRLCYKILRAFGIISNNWLGASGCRISSSRASAPGF